MKFVVFAEDWGAHPSSTQHIFKFIAKSHEVIWFNSVGMRTPKLNVQDAKRVLNKLSMFIKPKHKGRDTRLSIKTQNPILLPWHNNAAACQFNRYQVNRTLNINDDEPIIYWLSVPTAINMINVRPQDTLIYYCGDDFSSLAGVDPRLIKESEQQLIHQSDHIYVASKVMLSKMPSHKTQILEHGVDFELFTSLTSPHPEILKKQNVIGFYGAISTWLDCDLLIKLAKSRPKYHLVLVGNAQIDISKLTQLANVTHLAAVDHSQLVRFSQHWQVSVLPFLENGQIKACDPLKLKEYLAAGKPIVSTRFPAVERYSDVVFIADDHDGFIARIDHALCVSKEVNLNWKSPSRELVQQHAWKNKASFVLEQFQ